MCLSLKISLALLCLLSPGLTHESQTTHCKTLASGPPHEFHTVIPIPSPNDPFFNSNPFDISRGFVMACLKDPIFGDNGFTLCKESYTDEASGITHAFYCQIINGIEVVDGNISVNIKDRAVISYNDSVSIVV